MWTCSSCGKDVDSGIDTCWNCGTGQDGTPTEHPELFDETKRDVAALSLVPDNGQMVQYQPWSYRSILACILDIMAIILALIALTLVIILVVSGPVSFSSVAYMLFCSAVGITVLLAVAAILRTLLDIEAHLNQKDR